MAKLLLTTVDFKPCALTLYIQRCGDIVHVYVDAVAHYEAASSNSLLFEKPSRVFPILLI